MTIKTTSGYCPYNYAYEDKMVITGNSIAYINKPVYPDGVYAPVKWSYKMIQKPLKTGLMVSMKSMKPVF